MRPATAVSSSAQVSARMSRQRRRDTGPELALRRELHRRGYRFRVSYPVPGLARRTIDVAFTRLKVAVFVDGCFWHACPEHATWPRSNEEWWRQKLDRNVSRDDETASRLREHGWQVVRIWEHATSEEALKAVLAVLPPR